MRLLIHALRRFLLGPRLARLGTLNDTDILTLLHVARNWNDGTDLTPGISEPSNAKPYEPQTDTSFLQTKIASLEERIQVLERQASRP